TGDTNRLDRDPELRGYLLDILKGKRHRFDVAVPQDRDFGQTRYRFLQQLHALGRDFGGIGREPRHVPARFGETLDDAGLNRSAVPTMTIGTVLVALAASSAG